MRLIVGKLRASVIFNPKPLAMSLCSTFPITHFNGFTSIPTFPLLYLSPKPFSSRVSASSIKAADEMPMKIGFLGLGIMGSPMAQNLLKAGCNVTVWNRTESKCDPLISLGAKYKPSPEEVAAACDVTFAMLADPESAVDVACGENGASKGMSPGKGYVDVSTVDGATSKHIGAEIKASGALFLEYIYIGVYIGVFLGFIDGAGKGKGIEG